MVEYTRLDKFLLYISLIFQIISTIILVAIMVKEGTSLFHPKELYSFDGNVLYGEIPEKVKVGNTEYDNPLYVGMREEHWEPSQTKSGGYTTWKRRR